VLEVYMQYVHEVQNVKELFIDYDILRDPHASLINCSNQQRYNDHHMNSSRL
jgi:hypothetical protein